MKYAYACKQYDYRATTKYSLDQHKRAVHERVKYACRQCDHKATSKSSLGIQKRKEQFTKGWSNCQAMWGKVTTKYSLDQQKKFMKG